MLGPRRSPVVGQVVEHLCQQHKHVPAPRVLRRQRVGDRAPRARRRRVGAQRRKRAAVAGGARDVVGLQLRQARADLQGKVGGRRVDDGVDLGHVVLRRQMGGGLRGAAPAAGHVPAGGPGAAAIRVIPAAPAAPAAAAAPPFAPGPAARRTRMLAARLPVPPPTSTIASGSADAHAWRRSSSMYLAIVRPNHGRNTSAGVSQSTYWRGQRAGRRAGRRAGAEA
jgi:hypothetical protein